MSKFWGQKMILQNGLNQKLEPILWPRVEILGSKNDPSERLNQKLEPILWPYVEIFGVQKWALRTAYIKSYSRFFDPMSKFWVPKMTLQNGLNHKLEPIVWPYVEFLGSKNDPSERPKSKVRADSLTPYRNFGVKKWRFRSASIKS